jgi:hypothetical protein
MRICVFCGSSTGRSQQYVSAARTVGRQLARRGVGLVYGGAQVGTMGVLANAALDAGGEVIGVIPAHLVDREIAHTGLSDLHVVSGMHERKARMAEIADAFLALPGGAGTLEELFEVWTWAQLGLHDKPIALLDIAGFFQPLLAAIDHMVTEEFLPQPHRDMLVVAPDIDHILDRFAAYQPPESKWGATAAPPRS